MPATQYKITGWFSLDSVIARARLAVMLGDKVVEPLYIDWLGRAVIVMQRKD